MKHESWRLAQFRKVRFCWHEQGKLPIGRNEYIVGIYRNRKRGFMPLQGTLSILFTPEISAVRCTHKPFSNSTSWNPVADMCDRPTLSQVVMNQMGGRTLMPINFVGVVVLNHDARVGIRWKGPEYLQSWILYVSVDQNKRIPKSSRITRIILISGDSWETNFDLEYCKLWFRVGLHGAKGKKRSSLNWWFQSGDWYQKTQSSVIKPTKNTVTTAVHATHPADTICPIVSVAVGGTASRARLEGKAASWLGRSTSIDRSAPPLDFFRLLAINWRYARLWRGPLALGWFKGGAANHRTSFESASRSNSLAKWVYVSF